MAPLSTIRGIDAEAIATRTKQLEEPWEMTLPSGQPYLIRLDGVAFRTFTEGLKKPFDARLTRAMILTTRDLLERCMARLAYCQSDEISLLFAPEPTPNQIVYGGRNLKIASVFASMASARFTMHMRRMDWEGEPVPERTMKRILNHEAWFDGRVFSAPSECMAMEAIYWRHALDGRRNAINMIAHTHFPHRQLQGVSLGRVIEMLSTNNVDPFKDFPPAAIYGAFLKKAQYPHMGFNPKTGVTVPTVRSRVEARSFDLEGLSQDDKLDISFGKYWSPSHPASLQAINLD